MIELTPVELYMLTRLISDGKLGTNEPIENIIKYDSQIRINLGEDVNYSDFESKVLCENLTFDGKGYYDTNEAIMEIDRDFTIAIDYEFAAGNSSGYTLVDCYD
jgi:hypothetical protein